MSLSLCLSQNIRSRSVVAGLCAALYYFCIHNDATRIHSQPVARENFAIPFLISQMYFLSVWIEKHNRHYRSVDRRQKDSTVTQQQTTQQQQPNEPITEDNDRSNHFKFGFFTAFPIMAWDFATYIYATQILIVMLMVKMRLIKRRHKFLQNFILAHIMARLIANNIVKYGWIEFHQKPMNFDCSALITLLLYLVQKYPTKQQQLKLIERILLRLFLLIMACTTIFELFSDRNFYSQYMDVLLSKLYLKEPTFTALLAMCRKDYQFIDLSTLNTYNCLFVSKILVVFMLTCVVNRLKRNRELNQNANEQIQRAKNYVLEDYLEQNKLSVADLAKIERNEKLQACMDLLKTCKYDYELYKFERKRIIDEENKERPQQERDAFLNEIRRYKNEINEASEAQNGTKIEHEDATLHPCEQSTPHDKEDDEKDESSSQTIPENEPEINGSTAQTETEEYDWKQLFAIERAEYFYNLMQTIAFFLLTILIVKVKYVLTPFLCLMASTFPPKALIPRNYGLWLMYIIVIGSCCMDRGIQNIREQYNLKETTQSKESLEQNSLHDMLKWIKSNTDRSEVFAGPDDIIGLVLLATGRSIVNNPIKNHPAMM